MTSLTPDDIDAALDLADLIDAQDPPRMFYVPDSEGFERRIRRHAITVPHKRQPSRADLQFVKACRERLRVRLAGVIPET
jgi:hypothetical protein